MKNLFQFLVCLFFASLMTLPMAQANTPKEHAIRNADIAFYRAGQFYDEITLALSRADARRGDRREPCKKKRLLKIRKKAEVWLNHSVRQMNRHKELRRRNQIINLRNALVRHKPRINLQCQ